MAHYLKQLFFSVEDVFPDAPPLTGPTPEAWIHPAGQRERADRYIHMDEWSKQVMNVRTAGGPLSLKDRNNTGGDGEVTAGISSWNWGGLLLAAASIALAGYFHNSSSWYFNLVTFDNKRCFPFELVDRKMQKDRVCLCTNTPGDSNNNAAILGSCRAARAVRPFVSRGHSLHYNPKDKAPWGATQDQVGGGIVPHSMHSSLLLQTYRKYTLQRRVALIKS